jgi:hypothetical protein
MKHNWRIQRRTVPLPNGQQRWDQVYQHLLQWTNPHPTEIIPVPTTPSPQEASHARSSVSPGFHLESSPRPDD